MVIARKAVKIFVFVFIDLAALLFSQLRRNSLLYPNLSASLRPSK